ncbi:MAG TPA: copper oxidase [Thermoanaerobaculia bacterium]|nr:copper oxidase [Thermoanaerobaculia bacterium]
MLNLCARIRLPHLLSILALLALPSLTTAQTVPDGCARLIKADVVALDQVFFWNRLGAVQPQGMMFALRRDVCTETCSGSTCTERCGTQDLPAGNVYLRADKRPRPLVLRMNVGDCLEVKFQNLLNETKVDQEQPATRQASFHPIGLQLVDSILDDGSYVGKNPTSLAEVADRWTYTFFANREGEHVVHSTGTTTGGQGDGGQINAGLFGAVIVEPEGSRWYRSQVTKADLDLATVQTLSTGQPKIDYEARYPAGHPKWPRPVLNMLDGSEIVHSDVTAVIAGSTPNTQASGVAKPGWFPSSAFPLNQYTYPERYQPFRELVTIYHDEIGAVQAFPEFEQPALEHTLHSGRDAFAINYGAAGIGAEVLANRFKVGPQARCTECKFEEFFLSSWVVGDPAMVVDVPANTRCMVQTNNPNKVDRQTGFETKVQNLRDGVDCDLDTGRKANKAFFPDDPSNVYHGYIEDHTKFRVLHAGSKEHHVHHLHAHQWLFTADSDKSTYLDSQAIGPGASFTAEIAYHGGGNLNKTVGDSIFHCHFYPHFAQGMWALWRVHDVFERGTAMGTDGRPTLNARALPDGEILAGTPIPAVVPLPGKPMAPVPEVAVTINRDNGQAVIPAGGNPGFPFFVAAIAGHRPPHPPKDIVVENGVAHDGGLPRHRVFGGEFVEAHTRLDFHKELIKLKVTALSENGTAVEQEAMDYHAQRQHPSCRPDGVCDSAGTPVKFITNGRPAVPGAPFADPCINAEGTPVGSPRLYKAADIEDDVKINKKGWHFPQQRFSALWQDVDDYLSPAVSPPKPPEPLFFRANSKDCINFWFTNLAPHEYQLDDFQVRTPTDILGQHIHLVKFDVLASDGAANGFNYEDGSFAPAEVRERIDAIRLENNCTAGDSRNGTIACPVAKAHPFFGAGAGGEWMGAQTTVQRWYADPVLDNNAKDRTLRTVFTHDHFGPSTHQQAGLYAGLVIEPTGSTWFHNESGTQMYNTGGRHDGGPTSWQAVIVDPNGSDYREFLLEFGDFQLAYEEDSNFFPDPPNAVNPPGRKEVGLPELLARPDVCPDGVSVPPCPELVSADDPGTMSLNYRQEPLALRVRDPQNNEQATTQGGNLSFAFSSRVTRKDTAFNSQPNFYQPLTNDLKPGDPFTPLLRAYENDRVQIRVLVGAHEEGHNFSIHGIKWLFEPSEPRSGYRGSQMMGISEHFEFIVPQLMKKPNGEAVDRLYAAGSSSDDYWNGIWGLFRAYTGTRQGLMALPDNPNGRFPVDPGAQGAFDFSCPKDAPVQTFDVSAIAAKSALSEGRLFYNNRIDGSIGKLYDEGAILYVMTSDLDPAFTTPRLKDSAPREPLILRARAGDCIKLTLRNKLPDTLLDRNGFNTLPMIVEGFNANDVKPSKDVGLHPQLLYYDVSRFDGANVGDNNLTQTVPPGQFTTYEWYAGDVVVNANGTVTKVPIEFGATNLISSDRIEHASKGAIGALIIEPQGSTWTLDPLTRAAATVTSGDSSFREFVLLFQTDLNLRTGDLPGQAIPNLAGIEDPEDSGQKGLNYRTEPLWKRMGHPASKPLEETRDLDWHTVLSNFQVGGADPQTPVFTAAPSDTVRFRLLAPGGHTRNSVFVLHGHIWDREPYIAASTQIGRNSFSFWEGAHGGHGPSNHFDVLLRNQAGGAFNVTGDYLYRDFTSILFDGGIWGILRVEP